MKYHFIKNHLCSHCFKPFRLWQSPFVCASSPSFCAQKAPLPMQPLAFVKSIWQNHVQANCPHCCYETTQQTCPHCQQPLLKDYFKSKVQLISLVAPDLAMADSYLEKLLLHIQKFGLNTWVLSKMDAAQQAILLTAGTEQLWIRFSMSTFAEPPKADLEHSNHVFLFLEEKESEAASKFLQKLSKKILKRPFAIIWPHLDKIMNFLPKTNVFFQKNLTAQEAREVHLETSGLIGSYVGINFLNYLKTHLKNYHFFALNLTPSSQTGWRLEDPLVWSLKPQKVSLKAKGLSLISK